MKYTVETKYMKENLEEITIMLSEFLHNLEGRKELEEELVEMLNYYTEIYNLNKKG